MTHLSITGRHGASVAAFVLAALLAGCGGGGSDVVVVATPPPIFALGIVLTRTGPETVQVDWSDDASVDTFDVVRDGDLLAAVRSATTLIDNSVILDQSYCYVVNGYDASGELIAQSDQACITIVP
jgi:hypothetical protein